MDWGQHADAAQRVLRERFWSSHRRLYLVAGWRRFLPMPSWHYWWQAHALDATVDGVARSGDHAARERIRAHVAGIVRRNGGRIPNDYYDDMAWMALALLRADQVAGVGTAAMVAELWAEIRGGWDARHGGIVWRRGDTYTNAPANAPAAILAARLHRRYGDPRDLDWSRRILDWLRSTLVDPGSGLVWDGIHPETSPAPSRELYTYNQGTVVGAEVELFRLTGQHEHLARARRTAAAALDHFTIPATGLLPDEGAGDGGLFKGILVHYLAALARADPALARADPALARADPTSGDHVTTRVVDALRRNGSAVARSAGRRVGADWARPDSSRASLSTQLSANLLLEALAATDHPGMSGDRGDA